MKRQEFEELKNLTIKELEQKRLETTKKLYDIRFQVRLGQEKNVRILRNLRKEIAQINTIIQQKKKTEDKERGKNGS